MRASLKSLAMSIPQSALSDVLMLNGKGAVAFCKTSSLRNSCSNSSENYCRRSYSPATLHSAISGLACPRNEKFLWKSMGRARNFQASLSASPEATMADKAVTLSSGHKMPKLGLGVWRADPVVLHNVILEALKLGYRHFDCAADYKNEKEVGVALAEGISKGLVKREELFITTKLWNSDHGHVKEACKDSLKNLQLEYLDLYLIHFPIATRHTGVGTTASAMGDDEVLDIDVTVSLETTWHAMEELVSTGLAKSIGISNYDIFLTRDCLAYSKIKPAVNQIETHPYFQRESLVKFCLKHGIAVTAHTPLGGGVANTEWFGSVSALDDPILQGLARKYGKTPAQIILRWGIQRNTIVIPKSDKTERLKQNLDVFEFELTEEDMKSIKSMDKSLRTNNPAKFWGVDLYS